MLASLNPPERQADRHGILRLRVQLESTHISNTPSSHAAASVVVFIVPLIDVDRFIKAETTTRCRRDILFAVQTNRKADRVHAVC